MNKKILKLILSATVALHSLSLMAIDLPSFGPKMKLSVVRYGLETNTDKHQIHFYSADDTHIDTIDLQITNELRDDKKDGHLMYKGNMIAKAYRTKGIWNSDGAKFTVQDEAKQEIGKLEIVVESIGFFEWRKSVKIFKNEKLIATVNRAGESGKDLFLYVEKTKKNISKLIFDCEDELPKFNGIIGVNATKKLDVDLRVILLAMGKAVEAVY